MRLLPSDKREKLLQSEKLLMRWTPLGAAAELTDLILQLLPKTKGGLVQLIWDLREGIKLPEDPSAAFDVILPEREIHPQAYPNSARKFLRNAFPKAYSLDRSFSMVMGWLGRKKKSVAVERFDPRKDVHNATPPIAYCYEGQAEAVAQVRRGAAASVDSRHLGQPSSLQQKRVRSRLV